MKARRGQTDPYVILGIAAATLALLAALGLIHIFRDGARWVGHEFKCVLLHRPCPAKVPKPVAKPPAPSVPPSAFD